MNKSNDSFERDYLEHLAALISAPEKKDRTGTGTRSIFGHQTRVDLRDGFPLLTTKRVFMKGVIHELLWFLRGDTNIDSLNDAGVHIWDAWADECGDLGPVYGAQWCFWPGEEGDVIDQIDNLVESLRNDPYSRRHIVTAWNPADLPHAGVSPQNNVEMGKQALAPCHTLFQVNMEDDGNGGFFMDLQLYQRSADWFLGVPFNIASYSLLLMMLAQQCDATPRYFIHSFGDTHLYGNHVEQAKEQLKRQPFERPTVKIEEAESIDQYAYEMFELIGYKCHDSIKAPIAV